LEPVWEQKGSWLRVRLLAIYSIYANYNQLTLLQAIINLLYVYEIIEAADWINALRA
jgi:hypothetical protein